MLQSSQQQQSRSILNANQFNCVRKIGKGGFGHVLLATKATSSSTYYAIKCLSRKKMIRDPALRKSLAQQINTMAAVQHPNIVKLFKTFEEGDWYFLVMEYCDMGNLQTMQSKLSNRVFPLEQAVNIFNQVLRGVEAIHRLNIVHRDIKPENIFVRKTQKNGLVCKIGDFGLARFLEVSANSNCGTQNFMAPQILEQVPYGKEVDVWSLGVLLFYLLFGDYPFKGINVLDDISQKCNGGFKLYHHKGRTNFRSKKEQALFTDLFTRAFQPQPRRRITIGDLKNHLALKIKQVDEDPSTEEEAVNEIGVAVEWEVNQIRFVQKISRQIEQQGFMHGSLLLGFKFYINKVLLFLINKQVIRNYRKDRQGHPKLLRILKQMEGDLLVKLERYSMQIKQTRQGREVREAIAKFEEGLNTHYQDFSKFKVGYRNTIGKVYQQVHRKYPENTQERAGLKLKVFFCHIINRVFAGPFNSSLFPHFATWFKKNKGKTPKSYDFRSLQEWIEHESMENLNASQEIINHTFYK